MTFRIITIFQNNAVIHLGTSKLKFQITRYRKKTSAHLIPSRPCAETRPRKFVEKLVTPSRHQQEKPRVLTLTPTSRGHGPLKKEAEQQQQQQEGARLNAERINTQLSTLCLAALEVLSFLSFDRLLEPPLKAAAARWQFTCAFEEIMSWRGRTVRQLIKMAKIFKK